MALQCRCTLAVSEAGHPVPFQQHAAPPRQRHHHHSLSRRPAVLAQPPFPALQAAALAAHHSSVSHPHSQTRHSQQPVSLLPLTCPPMRCTSCIHLVTCSCVLRPSHGQASPQNPPPPPRLLLQCELLGAAMRIVLHIQGSVCVCYQRGVIKSHILLPKRCHQKSSDATTCCVQSFSLCILSFTCDLLIWSVHCSAVHTGSNVERFGPLLLT